MKKVSLLFLSASLCASAFAGDVYLIKDGKLQAGVSYEQWEDAEGIPCGKLTEGDGFATLNHEGQYYDASLVIDQSVLKFNLMGKNLVVEYQLPAEAMMYDEVKGAANLEAKTAAGKDKPSLIISASKGAGEDAKIELTDKNNISFVNVDGKFNPEAEKGFVKYEGCAFAKSSADVATVFITFIRENGYVGGTPAVKIKNLYYTEPEVKPFYSCAFDAKDTWTETINVAAAGEDGTEHFAGLGFFQDKKGLTISGDDEWEYTVDFKMLYQNGPDNWTGSDGSGFLSSELYHGLLVKSPADFAKEFLGQDIVVSFEDIALPAEIKDGKINVSCLICKDPKSAAELQGDAATEFIPMFVKFDNDETEYQLYTKSIINGQYTQESEDVAVPAGAKSVSVRFKANPTFTYIVDNLILAANYSTSVAKVNGDSKSLSIYPNPVVDEIAFSGIENIESVEIVSLNGASVPCAVVNGTVNVSNLAAGEYVVIVNNAISGKFIKK